MLLYDSCIHTMLTANSRQHEEITKNKVSPGKCAVTQTTVFTCSCRSPQRFLDSCWAGPPFPPAPWSLDLTSHSEILVM